MKGEANLEISRFRIHNIPWLGMEDPEARVSVARLTLLLTAREMWTLRRHGGGLSGKVSLNAKPAKV